jgi:pilus assembly protein Flp/PilA
MFLSSIAARGVSKMIIQTIKASVLKFIKDENGLTIVEYAVAGGLITVGVVVAFTTLGENVNVQIKGLCNALVANGGKAC